MRAFLLIVLLSCGMGFSAHAAPAPVVASIKPLHSLVAAVMEGDDSVPLLLVDGKTSPHYFSLKPSQARALAEAKIVFYMGASFETFLSKTLAALPPTVVRAPAEESPGLMFYPARTGEERGHDEHGHEEGARDLHLWLSPANARAMVMDIARELSAVFPEKRELYFKNAKEVSERIRRMDKALDRRLSKVSSRPFVVFHDAYQYFEKSYGLKSLGAITLHPEHVMSAGHLSEIREEIQSAHAVCVFREPQFEEQLVKNLVQGTDAKIGVLDPEGGLLEPGPELYFKLMENLAKGLEECLR